MPPRAAALLWDMVDHARYIADRCQYASLQDYDSNRDLRLAVERAFENIGEAARRLSSVDPAIAEQISGLPTIISFRNVLAHEYDEINNSRVWTVIKQHIPVLIDETTRLLERTE
ncbi:MAG: DUF86 domain-containing protein [Thermomicrobiales bacterium]|nr:DUF86 domain-containing protein [Thermomicrobiales bacterium]